MDTPKVSPRESDTDKREEDSETNLYGATKRSLEFTSENHKLEISNLPPKQDYHLIRHLLERQFKLQPHKIRVGHGKAFVAFASEQARDEALRVIHNHEWKGNVLVAKPAAPRHDPMAKRVKTSELPDEDPAKVEGEEEECMDINTKVCPLLDKPYQDQLKIKESAMRHLLNFSKPIRKFCQNLEKEAPKLFNWLQENSKIACQFDGVEPSPILVGYRNKCEFNVDCNGTVGFRVGRYKNGSEKVVAPPPDCPLLNDEMFKVLKIFQEFLNSSTKLKGFDHVSHEGHVRQITIRSNQQNDCLVIVDLNPQELTEQDINTEVESLKRSLLDLECVKSIFLNTSNKNHFSSTDQTVKLIYGQEHLQECLHVYTDHTLKFRIGPTSFFQVNTKACELLYRSIIELSGLGPKSLVLDVGCGIGTISLSVAKKVAYVIGIEIVESAVEDAKKNAKENSITNVSFVVGRAEELTSESISVLRKRQVEGSEIVAIVDPPRSGFNNSFIKHLRASSIRKIVYIACDPKANTNLTALCRPTSKAYRGEPFVPTRAKAFDLFPHTKFCELLLVYERLI